MFEKLEKEFQPLFDKRVKEIIEKEKVEYSRKYPFVKEILIGMGSVVLIDRDGIYVNETNWFDYDKRLDADPDSDGEAIFYELQQKRDAAILDEFIQFLQDVHCSRFCDICPEDIIFE